MTTPSMRCSSLLSGALIALTAREVISFATPPAFRPSLYAPAPVKPTAIATSTTAAAGRTSGATTTTTALSAGFVAGRYLSTLSPYPDSVVPPLAASATERYLTSLSRLENVDPSRMAASSPEEYLAGVARIVDESADAAAGSAGRAAASFADGGSSFYIAASERLAPGAVESAAGTLVASSDASAEVGNIAAAAAVDAAGRVSEAVGAATAGLSDAMSSAQDIDLRSQLSGLSYDSIVNGNDKTAPAFQRADGDAIFNGGGEKISENFNAVAAEWSNAISGWGDAGAAKAVKLFQKNSESAEAIGETVGGAVRNAGDSISNFPYALQAETNRLAEQSSESAADVAQGFGEQSLSSLAGNVVAGIKIVGYTLLANLDNIVLEYGGSPLDNVLDGAKTSVAKIVDGAVQYVVSTVNNFGDITLAQTAQNMIKLMAIVVKSLFAVLGAVVKIASGKDLGEYWVTVTGTVERGTSELAARAGALATDLTHTSFSELGAMVGDFSEDASDLMVQSVGIIGDAVAAGGGAQLADIAPMIIGS